MCQNCFSMHHSRIANILQLKDLGELHSFLGIEIARFRHGILINQWNDALHLIDDFGLTVANPC